MSKLGSEQNPLRVAVVGSGPSGFYAAEALIKSDCAVRIDMYERLPAPYGLVRYGVAPDHPKLKQAILVYDKIAQYPEFNFIGNVTVGEDLSVDELRATHHVVFFTCGAETDRKLGIPGEDLDGSYTATEFVGWYNGHPDYRERNFDLSHEVAVIIGQGNVAADVARVLAKTVDELKHTDIAEHALDALAQSRIREIHVIGRRGPAQVKFTGKELREFVQLEDCDSVIEPSELQLNAASEAKLAAKSNAGSAKNMSIFQKFNGTADLSKQRHCLFRFLRSPVELVGDGSLEKVILERNQLSGEAFKQSARGTGEREELDCGILFRSIGYLGIPMLGVPFDDWKGVFQNTDGRICDGDTVVPGCYVAGWIKRGPTGIIGTNRADAVATVKALLEDLPKLDTGEAKQGAEAVYPLLSRQDVRVVNYGEWKQIDAAEVARGEPKGKPREKYTRVAEMLDIL